MELSLTSCISYVYFIYFVYVYFAYFVFCISILFYYKFVYMAHHSTFLRFKPFSLRFDGDGCWFEPSMSQLRVWLSAQGAKNVSWLWLSPLRGWGSLDMESTGKFVYMTHHSILLLLNPFSIRFEKENGGLSTLCQSCRFSCHQTVMKTFTRLDYLCSEDRVV